MKDSKRILAGLLAVGMAFSMTACGGDDDSKAPVITTAVSTPESAEQTLMDVTGQTLTWLSFYDLNPGIGREKTAALSLFTEQCGGTIKFSTTSFATQFEDLSTAVLSGNPPDIFPYDSIAFPSQVLKQFYQPIDSIVDFTTPLWAGVADSANKFVLNGEHYVAPFASTNDSSAILIYNKDLIEQDGLDDPMELYSNDEWTWDKWKTIMDDFMAGDNASEPVRKALAGWYQPALIQSTGKTMVTLEDGKFVNNINDPDIERAQNFISDLTKNSYYDASWYNGTGAAFKSGNILFYAMGSWALTNDNNTDLVATLGLVPMPRDPNTDVNYLASGVTTHMWVKGSTKNDAVKAWYECNRVVNTDPTYTDVNKAKTQADSKAIDDEMYEIILEMKSDKFLLMFDYGYGISPDMNKTTIPNLYSSIIDLQASTWTQVREGYKLTVDQELEAINNAITG